MMSRLLLLVMMVLVLAACARRAPGPPPAPPPVYVGPDPTWLSAPAPAEEDDETVIALAGDLARALDPAAGFQLGVERFAASNHRRFAGRRTMVLTSPAALLPDGRHALDAILASPFPNFSRVVLFLPDGASRERAAVLTTALGRRPGLPVAELAAPDFRPVASWLERVDFLIVDLPATGLRHTGELAVLGAFLEEAAARGTRVIVLDRPPLLDTRRVDGPLPDEGATGTRRAFLPMPPQPGLTPAEAARLFNGPFGIEAALEVVPMGNWVRADGPIPAAPEEDRVALLLRTTATLLEGIEAPYRDMRVEVGDGGRPVLRLVPTARPAAEIVAAVERERLVPEVLVRAEEEVLVAEPAGEFGAASLATALGAAASASPRAAGVPRDLGLFGARWIFEALAEGADGRAWRLFWTTSAPYQDYLRHRSAVALYPDQRGTP